MLQCPDCSKPLINIGSSVERIHPVARFIKNYYWRIQIVSVAAILLAFVGMALIWPRSGIAYVAEPFLLLPTITMFILIRRFSLYRVTNCPYCGFHHERKLGRSMSV